MMFEAVRWDRNPTVPLRALGRESFILLAVSSPGPWSKSRLTSCAYSLRFASFDGHILYPNKKTDDLSPKSKKYQ